MRALSTGRRRRRRGALSLVLSLAPAACAEVQRPRGGPEDPNPPRVVSIVPDTGATGARPRHVVIRFDEVVAERPGVTSARTLVDLVLVSPESGETTVDWAREELRVRPRRGWRPNTTYTVTLLPGIADLRRNVAREGARTVFSTGPAIDAASIAGRFFDWVAERPAVARVEAYATADTTDADTTRWVAAADSSGRFALDHLPPGRYVVRGFVDQTPNRRLDRSEVWDSTVVGLADSARVELLGFVHDTVGPGITGVEVRDSLTLRVTLDRPIAPEAAYRATLFTLRAQDSSAVPVVAVLTTRQADSLRAGARASDSTARAAPPPAARPALRPSRPGPPKELVLLLGRPLAPGTEYRLSAELRSLLSAPRTSSYRFSAGPAAPAPGPAAPGARGPAARPPGARPPGARP